MNEESEHATADCTEDEQVLVNPAGLQGKLKCPEKIADFCNYPVPC